jgi:hypothetical protein
MTDAERHARKCVEDWRQKRMANPEILNQPGAFTKHLAEAIQVALDEQRRRAEDKNP